MGEGRKEFFSCTCIYVSAPSQAYTYVYMCAKHLATGIIVPHGTIQCLYQ